MGFLMHLEDKVDIDELLSSIQQVCIIISSLSISILL